MEGASKAEETAIQSDVFRFFDTQSLDETETRGKDEVDADRARTIRDGLIALLQAIAHTSEDGALPPSKVCMSVCKGEGGKRRRDGRHVYVCNRVCVIVCMCMIVCVCTVCMCICT